MAAMCSEWLIADVVKYSEVFCYNKASVCFFLFSSLCKEGMALHTLAGCPVCNEINSGK